MRIVIAQIMWRNFRVNSLAVDHVLDIQPVEGYPHGRKALAMSDLWRTYVHNRPAGLLWLDPDVAADPDDLAAMTDAIEAAPAAVHTGLVKLWPRSTSRDAWIWSHRGGSLGSPAATQIEDVPIAYVSTCFLWTPAQLLDLAFPAGASWQWDQVDVGLSELALTHGIPLYGVAGCRPKHLHYREDHEPQCDL